MASVFPGFVKAQLFEKIPVPTEDFTDQTIVLTGANSGLGLDCAKHLARLNVSRLIIACRTEGKGQTAKAEILSSLPSGTESTPQIDVWELEMTNYASVMAFGDQCSQLDRLDGAVLNAGVQKQEFSRAEDNETTITVNVISTTLLALLLLPKLRMLAPKFGKTPHLTFVGSIVHFFAKTTGLQAQAEGNILKSLNDEKAFDNGVNRYNISKLLLIFIVRELATRITRGEIKGKPFVVTNFVAPGWCRTPLFRNEDGGAGMRLGLKILGRECEEGSRTLVHGCSAGKETHGEYVSENKVKPASSFVRSEEGAKFQKRLWKEILLKTEKIKPGISRNV